MTGRVIVDVYGRYRLECVRDASGWKVYRLSDGKRRLDPALFIPPAVELGELLGYLDDLLHEEASPGALIRFVVASGSTTER